MPEVTREDPSRGLGSGVSRLPSTCCPATLQRGGERRGCNRLQCPAAGWGHAVGAGATEWAALQRAAWKSRAGLLQGGCPQGGARYPQPGRHHLCTASRRAGPARPLTPCRARPRCPASRRRPAAGAAAPVGRRPAAAPPAGRQTRPRRAAPARASRQFPLAPPAEGQRAASWGSTGAQRVGRCTPQRGGVQTVGSKTSVALLPSSKRGAQDAP